MPDAPAAAAAAPIVALGLREIVLLLALIGAAAGLGAWCRLRLHGELLVATVRSIVQLLAVGLIIGWVFEQHAWYWVLGLLAMMTVVAGVTGARRTAVRVPGLASLLSLVLGAATAGTLAYIALAVVRLDTWDPRYLVPLGGMLIGNAMTAGTLALERLTAGLRDRRDDIEATLALGASPAQAIEPLFRAAVRAAMTPTINTMMIVGVVQLPGMMTGQMLGGTDPLQAAMYQLLILFAIAFSTLVTAIAVLKLVARRFFTDAWQLVGEGLRD